MSDQWVLCQVTTDHFDQGSSEVDCPEWVSEPNSRLGVTWQLTRQQGRDRGAWITKEKEVGGVAGGGLGPLSSRGLEISVGLKRDVRAAPS